MSYNTTLALYSLMGVGEPHCISQEGYMMSWSQGLMDWKNVHILYVHFLPLRVCNGVSEEMLEPGEPGHKTRHVGMLLGTLEHFPVVTGQIVI